MWRTTVASSLPERPLAHRLVERRVPHAGADRELAVRDRDPAERRDAVDVDEMRRPRQPERHDRHEALPARQHAAVVGRDLAPASPPPRRPSSARDSERRRASSALCGTTPTAVGRVAIPYLGLLLFFELRHGFPAM